MPTGLTYAVLEDPPCAFEEFVLRCARHIGICGAQRDEPVTMPPRLPAPDDIARHRAQVDMFETQLADARAMSLDAAAAAAERAHADAIARHEQLQRTYAASRGRVLAMLVRVETWTPPTPDHASLKKLMLQQLRDTYDEYTPAKAGADWRKRSAEEWRDELIAHHTRDLAYAQKHLANAEERFRRSTAWVTALYESLGMKPIAHDDFQTNPFRKTTGEKK